jgi:galactokinase
MTDRTAARRARELFRRTYGGDPALVATAPGRVNLIGEHVDYNGGAVLPFAIDRRTAVAVGGARRLRFVSEIEPSPTDREPGEPARTHWSDYVLGVHRELARLGAAPTGARVAVASDVPMGGGLSSSAALAVASALALSRLAGARLERRDLVDVAWHAEHDFVGVRVGRMDQTVIVHARAGHAVSFDFGTGRMALVPFTHPAWLVDTGVRHRLTGGGYNARRAECDEALAALVGHGWPVRLLADVPRAQLARALEDVPARLRPRVRHVVTETARTREAVRLLARGRLAAVGGLLTEAHWSMARDYEASCPEADTLVEAALAGGAHGARLVGAGWGGLVLVLAAERRAPRVLAAMEEAFQGRVGRRPPSWRVRAAPGARVQRTPPGR